MSQVYAERLGWVRESLAKVEEAITAGDTTEAANRMRQVITQCKLLRDVLYSAEFDPDYVPPVKNAAVQGAEHGQP